MKFTIINQDEIPPNLPRGTYKMRIVEAKWDEIKVEFINEPHDPDNPTLIKLIKE